ncbi:MAG TPA: T9SS type A sorting domain-containing protein [Bacteroidia bacterium]|nr:T9SS type A sorting domain-containing protein [Bacteroidia bacterium]
MMKLKATVLLFWLMFSTLNLFSQVQKGNDIDGEAANDYSGQSISMPDANTVAIGAFKNEGNGIERGHTRIYSWNGTAWVQKGNDIDGEADYDDSGEIVNMPDSNTVAISTEVNDGNGPNSGHVRIFSWDGTAWVQKGLDIDGEAADDYSGSAISMSDANTIAIGAILNDGIVSNAGHVRVFTWDGNAWVQKGSDIDGSAANDLFGGSVSMSDSNTFAVGAIMHTQNAIYDGLVRIFNWNGTAWIQKGADIYGEEIGDYCGQSVSMPDSNTVAIGAIGNNGNGTDAGRVRIFNWDGSAWVQKGNSIDGEAAIDKSGAWVSMPNSNMIAIGASFNNGNGAVSGHVRIFNWDGTSWVQIGSDIDGEAAGDHSGAVSMPDTNTLAIGAFGNDGSAINAGHVRVFTLSSNVEVIENSFGDGMVVFPNPFEEQLNINLGSVYTDVAVIVKNAIGQETLRKTYSSANKLNLDIKGEVGMYFVEVISDHNITMLKVIKK